MKRDPPHGNVTNRWEDIRHESKIEKLMDKRYLKIIELPHHTSATRKPMPLYNRAAQFSPFAALTGYEDVIQEATERQISSFGEQSSPESETD